MNKVRKHFEIDIDGPTLMDLRAEKKTFCVEGLIPKGVCILGGAPKVGKSWLALDLCIRVAKGEPLWDLRTRKGTTLYLALEDGIEDLQDRAYTLTDDIPAQAHFVTAAEKLSDGLCEQLESFLDEHPDTVLVVIDTFQIVRGATADISYAGVYQDVRTLKQFADRHEITILLVHHLRKQGDSDPLNRISGSTALTGATDGVFVLTQGSRSGNDAELICAGRRIRKREMQLRFENGHWELLADSLGAPVHELPEELQKLVVFVRAIGLYSGGNGEFAERFRCFSGIDIDAKHLKQLMQQRSADLEERGVRFQNWRSNGQRLMKIWYEPPRSDDGEEQSDARKEVVTVGTADTDAVCSESAETVVGVEPDADANRSGCESENSVNRERGGAVVGTEEDTDEMESGWVDEICDALGVRVSHLDRDDEIETEVSA